MAHAAESYSISTSTSLTFPRRVFAVAGWYGLIVMLPQYFLEAKIGRDYPPAITHAENFYGFIGCLLYTSPSPRDRQKSRMPSSA